VPAGRCEQIVHRHPPARLEREPEFMRGMSQVLRHVLAEPDEAILHRRDSQIIRPIQSSWLSTSYEVNPKSPLVSPTL